MGIPKFARFLINRYPLIMKSIQEEGDVPSIGNKLKQIIKKFIISKKNYKTISLNKKHKIF